MRSNFQIDGRERSIFVTYASLAPDNADFTRYEEHVGINGERLVTGSAMTVSYPFGAFGETDRSVLYLYRSSSDGRPALVAAGLAYSPETPGEMLDELEEYTGLEETDEVPGRFMERFVTVLSHITEETMKMVDGKK